METQILLLLAVMALLFLTSLACLYGYYRTRGQGWLVGAGIAFMFLVTLLVTS